MITELQRQERRKYIGSSDIAAILGIDPYRSAWDVYNTKVFETENATSDAMDAGNILERPVLDWAESHLRVPLLRDRLHIHPDKIRAANLDAETEDRRTIIEAKTSGITGPLGEQWGEDGSDEVPDHIFMQVQFQLGIAGHQEAKVAALLGGRGFCMFSIEPDEKLMQIIADKALAFWTDHVLARVEPDLSIPSLEIAKRIRRQPGKVISLPSDPVAHWVQMKDEAKEASERAEAAQALLLSYLGDAEAADTPIGRLNYMAENAGKRLDLDRLKAEKPDVYDTYAEPTTRRVLRLKAPKAEKPKKLPANAKQLA